MTSSSSSLALPDQPSTNCTDLTTTKNPDSTTMDVEKQENQKDVVNTTTEESTLAQTEQELKLEKTMDDPEIIVKKREHKIIHIIPDDSIEDIEPTQIEMERPLGECSLQNCSTPEVEELKCSRMVPISKTIGGKVSKKQSFEGEKNQINIESIIKSFLASIKFNVCTKTQTIYIQPTLCRYEDSS